MALAPGLCPSPDVIIGQPMWQFCCACVRISAEIYVRKMLSTFYVEISCRKTIHDR